MSPVKSLMDFVRILLTITRPFSYTLLDELYSPYFGGNQTLPPIRDKILLIPATELAGLIRQNQVKAEDVMKAYIERIQDVEPLINACVDKRFEEALKEAKEVDLFISSGTKSEEEIAKDTPLLGVPFTSKESIGVTGLAQTSGIYAARDRKAPEDGVAVSLYRKAGAIPVEVTNVPELVTWWDATNIPFGTSYNPYDRRRGTGGSSGGEGAIIAYAGAVIGIGTDIAGSIRIPCAFNGIYGIKPSPGMISNVGDFHTGDQGDTDKFVGTGPMCRYAKDLPLLAEIMSERRINFDRKVDFRKLKIYYMETFPGYLLKPIPEIRAAVRKAAKFFEETFNNKPTKISLPELQYGREIWEAKLVEAGMPSFKESLEAERNGTKINLYNEFIKFLLGRSEHTLQSIYYAAIQPRDKNSLYYKFLAKFKSLKEKLDELLEGGAILLLPTHPEPAPHHYLTIPKLPNLGYTCIFNILGYPATQIPAGQSNGLPIGIQVVSSTNNDYVTINAAVELEKAFGGWTSPSEIVE